MSVELAHVGVMLFSEFGSERVTSRRVLDSVLAFRRIPGRCAERALLFGRVLKRIIEAV